MSPRVVTTPRAEKEIMSRLARLGHDMYVACAEGLASEAPADMARAHWRRRGA